MSTGTRRYDDRNKPSLVLMVCVLTIAAYVFAVFKTYAIPSNQVLKALPHIVVATVSDHRLWVPPFLTFIWSVLVFIVIESYNKTGFGFADYIQKLRGPDVASAAQLRDRCKEWGVKQLRFMGIPVPRSKEHLHFEAVGSTGSGKSQVIEEYIESAIERGDRIISVDPNGTFLSKFFRPGDIVLNPFDKRGQSWSIFNEIQTPYDVEQYSVSLIPRSPSTEQEQWNAMARTVVAETMLKLCRLKKTTTKDLHYWLVIASNEELGKMLSDTAAAGMFHGSDETLGSVRTVLTRYITAHKYLEDPVAGEVPFSIRDWLMKGDGNMWITWREDMLPAQKPLVSCWLDVICASSLAADESAAKELHLVVDELDSLEKLNLLVSTATKARKHLFHIFAGFQSYAQLDATNGKDDAMTLRNSLRNSCSLGVASKDTYTAEQISKSIGEHEVTRRRISSSAGTGGGKATISIEKTPEKLVYPSEIHQLPDLTGYLQFSGDMPIARVTMKYKKRPRIAEPLIVIQNKWTKAFSDLPPPGLFQQAI